MLLLINPTTNQMLVLFKCVFFTPIACPINVALKPGNEKLPKLGEMCQFLCLDSDAQSALLSAGTLEKPMLC